MPATDDPRLPEIVTIAQAAKLLQIAPRTVQWIIDQGEMKARRVGGAGWIIRRAEVDRVAKRRGVEPFCTCHMYKGDATRAMCPLHPLDGPPGPS